jgi:hypothetical protein
MTTAAERSAPRRSEVDSVTFRGPARECFVPLADAGRLSRELRRVSCDGRDAAASAARRIDVALSADGFDVGPLPVREASAIQLAIDRFGRPDARPAPIVRLGDMLFAEYGTPAV